MPIPPAPYPPYQQPIVSRGGLVSTVWQRFFLSLVGVSGGVIAVPPGSVPIDTIEVIASPRLLGRGTGGPGPVEQVTVGMGLALTGLSLEVTPAAFHQRGTRAAQPAASAVLVGALYCVTDEGAILERSTGSAWEAYGPTLWSTGAVRFRYIHATTTTAPPTGNQVRFDAAHPYTSVTTVWVRNVTTDGVDTHGIMLVLTPGSTVYIQDRTTSAHYVVFTMTGDPIDHTDYVELPVAWKSNGTAIPNADGIEVVFIRFEA